jgi:hypothetical protein
MLACPIIFATLSIGTPLFSVTVVAKVSGANFMITAKIHQRAPACPSPDFYARYFRIVVACFGENTGRSIFA